MNSAVLNCCCTQRFGFRDCTRVSAENVIGVLIFSGCLSIYYSHTTIHFFSYFRHWVHGWIKLSNVSLCFIFSSCSICYMNMIPSPDALFIHVYYLFYILIFSIQNLIARLWTANPKFKRRMIVWEDALNHFIEVSNDNSSSLSNTGSIYSFVF